MSAQKSFNFHCITADGKILFSRNETGNQLYVRTAREVEALQILPSHENQKQRALAAHAQAQKPIVS